MKNWKAAGEGVRDQPDPTRSLLTLSLPSSAPALPVPCVPVIRDVCTVPGDRCHISDHCCNAGVINEHCLQEIGDAEEMGILALKQVFLPLTSSREEILGNLGKHLGNVMWDKPVASKRIDPTWWLYKFSGL